MRAASSSLNTRLVTFCGRSSGVMVALLQMPCRSGLPSAVLSAAGFACCAIIDVAVNAANTVAITIRMFNSSTSSPQALKPSLCLSILAVHQLFDELDTLELIQPRVRIDVAIQRHPDLPRPAEGLRIFDGRFVPQVIGTLRRVTLDDFQLIAVMIAGAIEPALIVEAGHRDDQRIAVPGADRLPHPRVDRCRSRIFQKHVADRARVLVR